MLAHFVALVTFVGFVPGALGAGYAFLPIVFPGSDFTVAFDINNSGLIVGAYGCCVLPLAKNAFLLSNGAFTTLPGFPGAEATNAKAINDAGDIVGEYLLGGTRHGFLLSGGVFTTIDFPGAAQTQLWGITNTGEIVGLTSDAQGFLFSGGTFTPIAVPGASDTRTQGINDVGEIVGSYMLGSNLHGFLLSAGVFSTIDVPGAADTDIFAINNGSEIVGRYQLVAGGDSHGFLLSGGSFTTLDVPGFTNTLLFGINDAGQIVGQAYNSDQLVAEGVLVFPDAIPPTITVSASPTTLWPPNGKLVPVTISGTITDASGVNASTATYAVIDEYGTVQPSGAVPLGSNGSYSFTIQLQASRRGNDKDGRHYTITVSVQDNAGNAGSAVTIVTVPHDQGK